MIMNNVLFGITCTNESFTRICIKNVNMVNFDAMLKLLNPYLGWKCKVRQELNDRSGENAHIPAVLIIIGRMLAGDLQSSLLDQ